MPLPANTQRNTILIIADDLSPDYFAFFGNTLDTVNVPNIRSLLDRGIRFTNLTSNPVCSSPRTTILTGRYSFESLKKDGAAVATKLLTPCQQNTCRHHLIRLSRPS